MGGWADGDLLGDLVKLAVAVNTADAVKRDDRPKSNDSTALLKLTKSSPDSATAEDCGRWGDCTKKTVRRSTECHIVNSMVSSKTAERFSGFEADRVAELSVHNEEAISSESSASLDDGNV
jgi:hypothetical protein